MTNKPSAVPSDIPVALRNHLHGVAKALDAVTNATNAAGAPDYQLRGDFTELSDKVKGHDDIIGGSGPYGGGEIDYVSLPPAPETFWVTTVGELVGLNWTLPESYQSQLIHKTTRIYRTAAKDTAGNLIDIGLVSASDSNEYFLGRSETGYYSDTVGYDEAFYYWIQFESNGGVRGTLSDVVLGQTVSSISARMIAANDYINASNLASDLRSNINSIQSGGTSPPSSKPDGTALNIGDLWIGDNGAVWVYLSTGWVEKNIKLDEAALQLYVDNTVSAEVAVQLVAQATDDGRAVIWYTSTAPTILTHPALDEHDLWVNGTDGKLYEWTGDPLVWVEVENTSLSQALTDASDAQATADGKIQFFYSAEAPVITSTDIPLGYGDIWVDSDDGTLKFWNGTAWTATLLATQAYVDNTVSAEVALQLVAQATDDGRAVIWYASTAPTILTHIALDEHDLWVNGTDGKLYEWIGDPLAWVEVENTSLSQALLDASNAKTTADGKIQFFYSAEAPVITSTDIPLGYGDIWVDSDDGTLKFWDGTAWTATLLATQTYVDNTVDTDVAAKLKTFALDGDATIWYSDTTPTITTHPTLEVDDIWVDTVNDKVYRNTTSGWVQLTDTALTLALIKANQAKKTADGKIQFFHSATDPRTDPNISPTPILGYGDIWVDSDDGTLKFWNGTAWTTTLLATQAYVDNTVSAEVALQLVAQAVDDGTAVIWYASTAPTILTHPVLDEHDLWVNGTDGKLYEWTGDPLAWVEVENASLLQALQDASNAQTTADGKIQFFYSAEAPVITSTDIPLGYGDIWVDSDDGTLKFWNGTAWTATLLATQSFVASEVVTQVDELVGYCESPTADANGNFPVWTQYASRSTCETAGGTWNSSGALAQEVKTVHTTVDANYTTIQADFVSKDGVSGKYSIKMDNNGVVSGFGLSSGPDAAGGVVSNFFINADNFAILGKNADGTPATTSTDAVNPFKVIYDSGTSTYTTLIDNAVIDTAEIANVTVAGLSTLNRVSIGGGTLRNVDENDVVFTDGHMEIDNLHIQTGQVKGDISSTQFLLGGNQGWELKQDGTAFFGSNTTIGGTLDAASVRTNTKMVDNNYGYTMPLVTRLSFTASEEFIDQYYYSYTYPESVGNEHFWSPYSSEADGDYPSGYMTYNPDVTGYPSSWDAMTIKYDTSGASWFGTSVYLPENQRIKSSGCRIVVHKSSWYNSQPVAGDVVGNNVLASLFLYGAINEYGFSYPNIRVLYATLTATGYEGISPWMEFPSGLVTALGGTSGVSGNAGPWWQPAGNLPNNLVFALGYSMTMPLNSDPAVQMQPDPTRSTQLWWNLKWHGGPRSLSSFKWPNVIISTTVENL